MFTNIFNNIRVKKSYKFFRKVTPKFLRNILKTFVYGKLPVFSQLGYRYIGPIDGHNIKELIKYFQYAKEQNKSIIVHIKTIKGKGYEFSISPKMIFKKIFGKSEVHYNYSNNEPINNVKKEFVQNDNINVNIKSQNTIIERNYFFEKD